MEPWARAARSPTARSRTCPNLSDAELAGHASSSSVSSSATCPSAAARCTRCSTASRTRSPRGSRPTPAGRAAPDAAPTATDAVEARLRDLGEFIRDQRRRDRLSLRKLSELAGHLEPVPEPDRAGSAQAVGRDPPGHRQGPAHLGRDALRAGRDPRRVGGDRTSRPRSGTTRRITERQKQTLLDVYRSFQRTRAARDRRRRRLSGLPGPGLRLRRPWVRIRRHVGRRLAVLSVHSSPLAQPGPGDGGGMSVYVRALASRAGPGRRRVRRARPARAPRRQPDVVDVEPGFRVVQLDAGPAAPVSKHDLIDLVEPMVDATLDHVGADGRRVRRAPRELLGLGRGRPPPEARARPSRSSPRSTRWPG